MREQSIPLTILFALIPMASAGLFAPGLLLLLLSASLLSQPTPAAGAGIGFEFHHRFSDRVRHWAEAWGVPGGWGPEKGTAEYYASLLHHDRAVRGRSLAAASSALTFADGNATLRINYLGFLHYAIVALGTPNVTFLVALDTGSDLFWVPCDCKQCAPTRSATYGNFVFDIYSPNASSTSQKVSCSNTLCDFQNQSSCTGADSTCPYYVNYVSANTSSSGVLVEDILYLTTEDATPDIIKAPVIFGCGEAQTGSFLDGAAPNGLFGLGMEKISVPSILSDKGIASNSFSMCFGSSGVGRINFGDKGSLDQQETPFVIDQSNPSYMINITGIVVGNSSVAASFSALIDSGTSFTYLADPMYTQLAESFNAQVKEKRSSSDPSIPFEYCYDISPAQSSISLPDINLTTSGGSIFPANDPIIVFNLQQNEFMYCLAVNKSDALNIIGQNFMTGLQIVFDRDSMTLGWKNFDCGNSTENTKGRTNSTIIMSTPSPNGSKHMKPTRSIFALLLLALTYLVILL